MDDKNKTLKRISALHFVLQRVVSQAVWVVTDNTTPPEYSKQESAVALQQLARLAGEWINELTNEAPRTPSEK